MGEALRIEGVKGLIFDWNGTLKSMQELIDQDREFAWRFYQRRLSEKQVRDLMGGTPQEVYAGLTGQPDISVDVARRQLFSLNNRYPKRLISGASEALHTLHDAGLRMGIVTSGPQAAVDQDAQQAGLPRQLFEFFHTGDDIDADVAAGRPAFGKAIGHFATLDIRPDQLAVVGDEPSNMRDALAAGIGNFVIISSGTMYPERILAGGVPPDRLINSIGSLSGVFGAA